MGKSLLGWSGLRPVERKMEKMLPARRKQATGQNPDDATDSVRNPREPCCPCERRAVNQSGTIQSGRAPRRMWPRADGAFLRVFHGVLRGRKTPRVSFSLSTPSWGLGWWKNRVNSAICATRPRKEFKGSRWFAFKAHGEATAGTQRLMHQSKLCLDAFFF